MPVCIKVQATPLLVPSFVTVAVNCWGAFTATLAEVGDTATEIGRSIMEALALAIVFIVEVATNNNWRLMAADGNEGGVAGAV